MKCMIPEISWHNREPILCIDIQPVESEFYRLATGGTDYHVLIWQARITENGAVTLDLVSDLTRHQRAVNAVRWSPNGQYLASADDDANIIVWHLKTDSIPLLEGETNDKETWIITKVMRGHKEDIYDLCWSPSGLKILSGSIDNTAIIWDFTKGKIENILTDHKGFVQGVCWDPKGEYLATLSSDRVCRVFEGNGKQVRARIARGTLPVPESHFLYKKDVKYFHDDTFKSYFRRISFSPDGNLIVAPAGCVETEDSKKALCGTYIFTLDCLTQPIAILPLQKQCSVAVRCCPILFELRPDGTEPVINLPYRMIIAVAAESDLILYDTQQLAPFAHLQKIHYTRLTDLTWSPDGKLLAACSTDGFCTLLTFETNELGTPYTKEESEIDESFINVSGCEEIERNPIIPIESKIKDEKPKRESFLLQWASKLKEDNDRSTSNKCISKDSEESKENKDNNEDKRKKTESEEKEPQTDTKNDTNSEIIEIIDSPAKIEKPLNQKTPRRIVPIRLNAPTNKERNKSSSVTKSTPGKRKEKPLEKDNKIHSLMNFLKLTPDKRKTSPAGAKVGLHVTEEESSNARDAWHTIETKKKAKVDVENDVDDLTESIPDFKLQLEESTTQKENKTAPILLEDSTDMEMPVAENKDKTGDLNEVGENKVKEKKRSCNEESTPPAKSNCEPKEKAESSKSIDNNVKKTPRRIQLITLSSPKHKKQKK